MWILGLKGLMVMENVVLNIVSYARERVLPVHILERLAALMKQSFNVYPPSAIFWSSLLQSGRFGQLDSCKFRTW